MFLLPHILILAHLAHGAPGPTARVCPHDPAQLLVPSGEFVFGSTKEEREYAYTLDDQVTRSYGWYEKETPGRGTTSDYCIDRLPVTQSQYHEFVSSTGRRTPHISEAAYLVHPYEKVKPYLWKGGSYPAGLQHHPVVLISREDAGAYCAWKAKVMDRGYRLPTEWEWEKAARGTDGRIFPWGNEWNANYLNSGERFGSTTPIGQFLEGRSPYGVLEMAGNTFEWTSTPWLDTRSRSQSSKSVLKGCSWDDRQGTCRAAMRHGRLDDSRHILIGFRCVSDVLDQ